MRLKTSLIMLFFFLIANIPSSAQDLNLTRKQHFNLQKGLAIEGYDPVAYFAEKKAIKGSKGFAHTYRNATYYFSSKANLDVFKKSPTTYEPQYGGWCAYAMGNTGEKVEVDPETFKIINDKLYLFYNKYFTNTLKVWNKNETMLKTKAEANWIKFFK
jgi:YHS domain-containing protein